jgi:hypothetical protein
MPDKKYRIIATDGNKQYEFFYITHAPSGDFYYGQTGSDPSRTSVHSSGVTNIHHNQGQTTRFPATQRLTDIKGLKQLCSMSIGKLVFPNTHVSKTPEFKKTDGLIYFDIRKFKNQVGIMIFLLEKGNFASLEPIKKIVSNAQIHILTETDPWLVVVLHDSP